MNKTMTLTEASLKLFNDYAMDAGNWSGSPAVGYNVGREQADKGNLTHLKKAGYVTTYRTEYGMFLEFTDAGKALAAVGGIDLYWF